MDVIIGQLVGIGSDYNNLVVRILGVGVCLKDAGPGALPAEGSGGMRAAHG